MIRGMERGIQKSYGHVLFEPHTASHQVTYSTAKKNTNPQQLPKLPVPKLSDTLQKYLKSVRPYLNDNQFAWTYSLVKDFEKGDGKKLQDLLQKRAAKTLNWLEEWWLNTAYLEARDPVVVFSSPGLVFPFRKFLTQNDQLTYAAKTLLALLEYKSLIVFDKIPLEKIGNSPLDMGQYKKIFGTCRIPCEKRDKLSYSGLSKHVTVFHNNHIFHLDLWGQDNKILSEAQIVQQLQAIVYSSQTPASYGIGILTSDNRDNWARAYQALSKDCTSVSVLKSSMSSFHRLPFTIGILEARQGIIPSWLIFHIFEPSASLHFSYCAQPDSMNRTYLKDIETSISVLCLDAPVGIWDCVNKDAQQTLAGAQTIYGGGSSCNGGNRWFDKTVQFIVGADGVTGLTYEHSPAEGQPIATMTDFIMDFLDKGMTREQASSSPIPPKRLDFNLDPQVCYMIGTARCNLDQLTSDLALNCFTFGNYGKNFIKSQRMSPDSYLQMAMQLAFYRLHHCPGAHYESAATRMYVGGRTETIRSCSVESIDFARKMLDGNCSQYEQLAAMQTAVMAHKYYTVQALEGLGVDRHLLGLKLTALENGMEVHKLYKDYAFIISSHMRISTSQVACRSDGFMVYGPLVKDGYATCYNPRGDDINFGLSAWHSHPDTSLDGYRCALTQSLQEMHDLLLRNTRSKL